MKKVILFFLLLLFGAVSIYIFSPSYRYSFEAKTYYEFGKYQKAYKLAKQAYELNRYNTMAFTILTQSKISIVWDMFIKESKEYFTQIESISNKETITKSDKMRIKIMLKIIMGQYKNLPHSKLLNRELVENANLQYKKAKEFYDGIFKK
jgi:tetratricopeptide (TPR) repeat protein